MAFLRNCVHLIDFLTDRTGRLIAWLGLGMAVITALVVVLRYGFNIGSILGQESVIYMHGSLFLLGAAYALKTGAHVRVDIFYRNFSPRAKAWVNSLGGIVFLLPLCTFIVISSWGYVGESWSMRETSPEPGGIPAVFLLKSLIPVAAINLALQGVAEIFRSVLVLVEGRAE
ncbi:MAG: TRAP-type mannitol/chloroaromatic compound transport system permease small subunit [Bacteroidia bacterium]|jgi:TRAP-type mannitol/chloroaromatic compound transport system permease small subunit